MLLHFHRARVKKTVGMGMGLFESSEVSKRLWTEADAHFVTKYGLSLLEIVRKNPEERQFFFGGPQGANRREFHQALAKSTDDGGTEPLFPLAKKGSTSCTNRSPNGLLPATHCRKWVGKRMSCTSSVFRVTS